MFQFKQFFVDDSHSGMKVTTDAVLLGAWTCQSAVAELLSGATKALDVGSGSGILSLIVAQRLPRVCVTAIDIDENTNIDARNNFAASPFASRLEVIEDDFLAHDFQGQKFDLIISNPPFFSETIHSPEKARAQSRSEGNLSISTLLKKAQPLLADDGLLAFVAPTQRDSEVLLEIALARLKPVCLMRMRQRQGRPLVRTFFLCQPLSAHNSLPDSEITVNSADGYTPEYACLTSDLYLSL